MSLCLVHRCLELLYLLGGFFFWRKRNFWLVLVWSQFCQLTKWLHWLIYKVLLLKYLFLSFTLRCCLSLRLRCFYWIQQRDGFCFHVPNVCLCLFVELSETLLRFTNKQSLLILLFWCGFPLFDLLIWNYLFLELSWVWFISSRWSFLSSTSIELDIIFGTYCLNLVFSWYVFLHL